jgi:hypothetical protein
MNDKIIIKMAAYQWIIDCMDGVITTRTFGCAEDKDLVRISEWVDVEFTPIYPSPIINAKVDVINQKIIDLTLTKMDLMALAESEQVNG